MTHPSAIEPLAAVLDHQVLSVDTEAGTAQVRFLNPDHAGGPLETAVRSVPNPRAGEEGEPDFVEETYQFDPDPNPHVEKTVRVPLDAEGHVDSAAWALRLAEQSLGVKARMDAAKAVSPAAGALEGLITPSTTV